VTPASGGDSVAFQVDVAHTGNQPASTLTPPLTRVWSQDLGGGVSYPLIVGGRVFVTVGNLTRPGSALRALDLATGNPLWGPIDLGGDHAWSGAAYDGGRVYVVTSSNLLTAFDPASGATVWSKQLPGQTSCSSPPTAAGGTVFVGAFGSGGTLYAVDGQAGSVLWTAALDVGDSSSPTLSDDGVFVTYGCVLAYAFSRTTGAPIWQYVGACLGGLASTSVLFRGQLWLRDFIGGNLVLDAASGMELGSFSATAIPAFAGQTGFFLLDTGGLQALDTVTRTILWTFPADGALVSAPLVVNGTVYVGSSNGALYGLDPATGATRWSDTLPWAVSGSGESGLGQPTAAMGAGGGALLVPAGTHLVCYR
jgi:outer membrane protein assembly factor BamB